MGSANVNLFAQWTSNPTYTVTYNGNGGGSGTAPGQTTIILTGAHRYGAGKYGSLVRTGYTFSGWDTVAAGTGTNYAADQRLSWLKKRDLVCAVDDYFHLYRDV